MSDEREPVIVINARDLLAVIQTWRGQEPPPPQAVEAYIRLGNAAVAWERGHR